MSWCSRPDAWSLALTLLVPAPLAAQGRSEVQLWGVALASRPAVYAAGLGYARRESGRNRVMIAAAGGATDEGEAAVRGELTWHFLLDPERRSGWGAYAGGGLALDAFGDRRARPFVEAVVGIETGPGGGSGLFLEAGFGGGLRAAAGFRWRKRQAPGNRARGAAPRRIVPPAQVTAPAVSGRGTTGRQ